MAIFDTLGKLAQIGGMVASVAGAPMVGVPLSIAGGAASGGSQGGLKGAALGAGVAGASQAASGGIGKAMEGLKTPVDTGAMTGYSEAGAPYTIPGARKNPIKSFTQAGKPLDVPASPTEFAGGS